MIVFIIHPLLDILKEANLQNTLQGKTRLRSSSPAQNQEIANNNEERYWGLQKPKWKF
jgi:hypothetical protein